MSNYILGIESSCDDTSAAVISNNEILSNVIASQEVHKFYGGVVPELASRAHQKNIIPVVYKALHDANINKKQIKAIAFTRGPGLLGSLLVGISFAKSFALALDIPLIEVDHIQGHILAHFIKNKEEHYPKFPFLCLIVSGGHTQIAIIKDYFKMEVIGETIDDAAGEAFDKTAKIMGLPYPGGPSIEKYAINANASAYSFAKPRIKNLDFSFSGLKTSFLYFLRDNLKIDKDFIEKNRNDLCASIQNSIVTILMEKLLKASKQTGIKQIAISGGVSANKSLQNELIKAKDKYDLDIFIPKLNFSTDNAAMISIAGYFKYLNKDFTDQKATAYAKKIR